VLRRLKEKLELCLVCLEPVDLLVLHREGADDLARLKEPLPFKSQAGVGGEVLVVRDPLREGALRNCEAESLLEYALRLAQRVAEIVGRDGFEDDLEGVGLSFAGVVVESAVALGAGEYVDCLQAVSPLALSDRELGAALRAWRRRLAGARGWHGGW
jgi:hypothetical protein